MTGNRAYAFERLEERLALAAQPIITEFLASNDSVLLDGNGAASDWIEIFNRGDQAVDLAGYTLTDDPQDLEKWTFPSVTLQPGDFLIVFASGNAAPDAGGNLHTNFALSAEGEYLALASPAGTILSQFGSAAEDYPAQTTDVAYGLAFDSDSESPVTPQSAAKYLIPTNPSVDATWTAAGFNDAAWTSGTASLGYESSPADYAGLIQTALPLGTTSTYVRIPFNVTSANASLTTLQLKFDDGFIAYLNGTRIASANAPAIGAFNSLADAQHPDPQAVQYVDYNVSQFSHLLNEGTNVLAIHMLNVGNSSDYLAVAKLNVSSGTLIEPTLEGFMISPTPGRANTNLQASIVDFSRDGGLFTSTFQLVMTAGDPTETIRYTTDGSLPGAASPVYTGPISISTTQQIRARAFGSDGQVGPVTTATYTRTASATSSFTSDLPIVVLENFGQGTPGRFDFEDAWLNLFEVDATSGRSSLAAAANFTSIIGQHVRGSSTAGDPKTNLRIELRDDLGEDQAASLLGMPSESDWILYAPYSFDRAMLRNTFYYDVSRQMGDYAARTRFVEVYANFDDGVLDNGDYMGVYVLMENIKRDSNRVDIAELTPSQNAEPDVTGGYIVKFDRSDGTPDSTWYTDRGVPTLADAILVHVEPERVDMTIAQRDYIRGYIQDFEDALYGPNSTDPLLGYEAYLDVDSAIDHHLLRILSKEPDSLRLSTFLVKDRGGKLEFGPVWDFDRSAGADNDSRSADPTGWYLPDVNFFESDWWGPLFDDPDFAQRWVDRWHELRQGPLSDLNILATINGQAAEIAEAQARNFARWPEVSPNGGAYAQPGLTGWEAEVSHLANWLVTRANWMDAQMVAAPGISPASGTVAPNTVVTFSANQQGANIYYTIDGTDPRADGGGVSPSAILYTGPFVVSQTTEVFARAKVASSGGGGSFESRSSYPPHESPSHAIDGDVNTKYLNFGEENSGLIITPASGASVLRSFRLSTANDAEDRDPTSYLLYGTNDRIFSTDNSTGLAENWTLISSGDLAFPSARNVDGPLVSFANSTAYSSYKLIFPTVKNAASANSMQFSELRLYSTANGTGAQIQSPADAVRAIHFFEAPLATSSEWSGLASAYYSLETPANPTNLRVTELHYHPTDPTAAELLLAPDTDHTDYEFIELKNISSQAISLSGVKFTVGVTFDFTSGSVLTLQPGATVLVVGNITAFEARYGSGLPVAGQFDGNLANSGEQIVLEDELSHAIHDFSFSDDDPWPTSADGDGPSLQIIDVAGDYSSGANWQASAAPGGTPGASTGSPGDFDNDSDVDGADFLAWQRGYPATHGASDLADWTANFGATTTIAAASHNLTAAIAGAVIALDASAEQVTHSAALVAEEPAPTAPGSGRLLVALAARGASVYAPLDHAPEPPKRLDYRPVQDTEARRLAITQYEMAFKRQENELHPPSVDHVANLEEAKTLLFAELSTEFL